MPESAPVMRATLPTSFCDPRYSGATYCGRGTICRKVSLGPGAELILDERHPLFQNFDDDTIVDALRRAIDGLGDQREPQH